MKTILALLLVVLSLIGIADASYITYEKITGGVVGCGQGFDCGTVLNSPYAQVGPIPLSVIGVVFYSIFLLLAGLNFLEIDPKLFPVLRKRDIGWEKVLLLLGSVAFLFSILLVFLMGVVIQAWCLFCLISAGTSSLLFLTSLFLFLSQPRKILAPEEK